MPKAYIRAPSLLCTFTEYSALHVTASLLLYHCIYQVLEIELEKAKRAAEASAKAGNAAGNNTAAANATVERIKDRFVKVATNRIFPTKLFMPFAHNV